MDKDKGLLDDANPMTQPLDGKPNLPVEVNPGLDQAKQTNVLLSNIVSLLQQLVDKTGSVQVTEQPKVEVETETETETEEESVKMISEWFTGINSRLKNLGL
jgi:NifB/MoaA-like Fe-S oxidoreductase